MSPYDSEVNAGTYTYQNKNRFLEFSSKSNKAVRIVLVIWLIPLLCNFRRKFNSTKYRFWWIYGNIVFLWKNNLYLAGNWVDLRRRYWSHFSISISASSCQSTDRPARGPSVYGLLKMLQSGKLDFIDWFQLLRGNEDWRCFAWQQRMQRKRRRRNAAGNFARGQFLKTLNIAINSLSEFKTKGSSWETTKNLPSPFRLARRLRRLGKRNFKFDARCRVAEWNWIKTGTGPNLFCFLLSTGNSSFFLFPSFHLNSRAWRSYSRYLALLIPLNDSNPIRSRHVGSVSEPVLPGF